MSPEERAQDALVQIRRILAAKGKLEGNYYLLRKDAASAQVGLVVTLSSKDPTGARALQLGTQLKKTLKTDRIARGLVKFHAKKLVFEHHLGTLPAKEVQLCLRTDWVKVANRVQIQEGAGQMVQDLTRLAALLKKAAVIQAGDQMIEGEGEVLADADLSSDLDPAELKELEKDQARLGDLDKKRRTFLKVEEDAVASRRMVRSGLDEIEEIETTLRKMPKGGEKTKLLQKLRVQRKNLREALSSGGEVFPARVGLTLSKDLTELSKAAEAGVEAARSKRRRLRQESVQTVLNELREYLAYVIWPDTAKPELEAEIETWYPRIVNPEGAKPQLQAPDGAAYNAVVSALYKAFTPPPKPVPLPDPLPDDPIERSKAEDAHDDYTERRGKWASDLREFADREAVDLFKARYADVLRPLRDAANQRSLTDPECDELLRSCDCRWDRVKTHLLTERRRPDLMWQMVQFRKASVDAKLRELRGRFDGALVAKSVGSQNLTSDYDLTLSAVDGSDKDVQAVRLFNAHFKARYGKQPGTLFDTNLYAKDFLAVKDNILEAGISDESDVDTVLEFLEADRAHQDIAALTKMREYLSTKEWNSYVEEMLKGLDKTGERYKSLAQQYDLADQRYLIKQLTVLEKALDVYVQRTGVGAIKGSKEVEEVLQARKKAGSGLKALQTAQVTLEQWVHAIEHAEADLLLEVRNDLYMDQMAEVRRVQTIKRGLEAALIALPHGDKREAAIATAEEAMNETDLATWKLYRDKQSKKAATNWLEKWLKREIDAAREQIKDLLGDANFFAAEAYLSEGPLQHIVNGKQSDNKEVLEKLRPEHYLESINEQTGDFLKDCGHFAGRDAEALYQTSKYLERMFEGISRLADKTYLDGAQRRQRVLVPATDLRALQDLPLKTPEALMEALAKRLLPIRGAKGRWATANQEAKDTAALDGGRAIYGMTELSALKTWVLKLSRELNKAVRGRIRMAASGEMEAESSRRRL